jgi:hypothetical protein
MRLLESILNEALHKGSREDLVGAGDRRLVFKIKMMYESRKAGALSLMRLPDLNGGAWGILAFPNVSLRHLLRPGAEAEL